jgi:hypothetical protein
MVDSAPRSDHIVDVVHYISFSVFNVRNDSSGINKKFHLFLAGSHVSLSYLLNEQEL